MNRILPLFILLTFTSVVRAAEFKHVGDFLLTAHFKLTGQKVTPIPMKPIAFRVFTDGVHIRVTAEGDVDAHTTFDIYRSDGIGRQRQGTAGALEVIPGLQATSNIGGQSGSLVASNTSHMSAAFCIQLPVNDTIWPKK